MKKIEFSHTFVINPHGIPFSEVEHAGEIEVGINKSCVYLSGDKNGLLALASKIIEVANSEVPGYHKHLDEVELPNVTISPFEVALNIGRTEK